MKKLTTFICLISILCLMSVQTQAQDWDYELHPRADVDFTHLDAELKIESDGQLHGDLIYSATFNNSFTDSLFFDAAGLDIQSVTINGVEAEYLIANLKLIIIPNERFLRDEEAQIGIRYEADPVFGTHSSASGTVWTSLLPRTTQHWLPIVDSPRTKLLTDFTFTHPAGTTVVSNGRKVVSEIVDTDNERATFSTEHPISASSLGWVLFNEVQTTSTSISDEIRNSYSLFSRRSDSQIYVYSETESSTEEILLLAADIFNRVTSDLEIEYRYGDLQIIVLKNDFLETKQFGDGLLFVYENKGDIKLQIEQGVVSLFAESLIKAPTWSDADAARIAEAYLMNKLNVKMNSVGAQKQKPYHTFSARNLALWQQFLTQDAPAVFLEGIEIFLNTSPGQSEFTADWNELSDLLYDETGRSWFIGFEQPDPEPESIDTTYSYTVTIDWEEGSTSAEIMFDADSISVDELVTVDATVIGINETRERELTFTGSSDGIVLNVPSVLENITLNVRDRSDVVLNPQKPFQFWMYQLRNDDDEERRAEAAIGISSYSDNPDIELLLNDVLRAEESDIVTAAVLKAMSEITAGASGTDERFLQYTSSNRAMSIRIVAVEALSGYEGNERVISRLQSVIRQESHKDLRRAALRSLSEIVEPRRFANISGSLISQDIVSNQIPYLLKILTEKEADELSMELADQTLNKNVPSHIKEEIINFLMNVDQSPDNWETRLADLLQDPHPGVRIAAAKAVKKLLPVDRENLIESVMPNEFDERVRRQLLGE